MGPRLLAASFAVGVMLTPGSPAQEWFRDARKSPVPLVMAETEALFVADVNGDGLPDVLVANADRQPDLLLHDSHVLLNRGAGRFENVSPLTRVHRFFLAAADFDGDGDVDVLYRRPFDGVTGVARNDGTATFTEVQTVSMTGWRAVVGDVDGDGTPDVFTGYGLYLGQGGLVFADASASLPSLGLTAQPVLGIADLDGDGDADLVIGTVDGRTRLLLNDGVGAFTDATATHMPVDCGPTYALAIADLDRDGDLDLVLGKTAEAHVMRNAGAALFTTPEVLPTGAVPTVSVAIGDVNGDGLPDIACGHPSGASMVINLGSRGFTPTGGTRWQPGLRASTALAFADVDVDGDLDLLQGCGEEPLTYGPGSGAYGIENHVFFNDDKGDFIGTGESALPDSAAQPWNAVGDLDGDGSLNVVYGGDGGRIWFNDGQGAFTRVDLGLPVAGAPVVGDLDADGDQDVVLLQAAGAFHVLRNPGDGHVWPVQTIWLPLLPPGVEAQSAALADLDGDGDLDVFVATGGIDSRSLPASAPDALWLNDGQGRFSDGAALLPSGVRTCSWDAVCGDVDGDGATDIVTDGGVVYLQRAPASFVTVPFHIDWNLGGCVLALGDLDGDGDLDVAVGNACRGLGCAPSLAGGPNVIHWNDGTAGFDDSLVLDDTYSTMTNAVVLGDVDDDGDLDIVFGQEGVTGVGHDNLAENLLFLNDGNHVFRRVGGATGVEIPFDEDDTEGLALGDIDGDGDADLLVFNRPVDPGGSPRDKVHVSLIRHLWAPYLARLGRDYVLEVHGADHGATVVFAPRPARIPMPPFGTFGLDPATTFLIRHVPPTASGRRFDCHVGVPDLPALAGLPLYFQALVGGPSLGEARLTDRITDIVRTQ